MKVTNELKGLPSGVTGWSVVGQYGIDVSFWGSENLKIAYPIGYCGSHLSINKLPFPAFCFSLSCRVLAHAAHSKIIYLFFDTVKTRHTRVDNLSSS